MSLPGYDYLRSLFFLVDEERAHHLALGAARAAQCVLRASGSLAIDPRLSSEVLGVRFPGPIGLAAGFDKNAIAPHLWGALGFGFAEMGTVTAHPQSGNPKPRMFRVPRGQGSDQSIGFQ